MLLCTEGIHDDPHRNPSRRRTVTGTQVAASGWKKVLKFGDNVWPPEPPREQVPGCVTIPDPTVPAQRVSRFGPRPPPGPPPGFKAPPQPYPSSQPPPPKARPTSPTAPPPTRSSASGSQSSSSAGTSTASGTQAGAEAYADEASDCVCPAVEAIECGHILQSVDGLHGHIGEINLECSCGHRQ